MPNSTQPARRYLTGNSGAMATAGGYRGGRQSRELLSWTPALRSADAELLPSHELLTARAHDTTRNFALVSGGIQAQLDNIIGSGLRLSAKPDWRALGLSPEWASEWSRDTESKFRQWAEDMDAHCDAARRLPLPAMIGMATRSLLITGDITASAEWLPGRGSRYATAIQMIDPARLSNPGDAQDSDRLRGGIELDRYGAPVAYHIRQALRSDAIYMGANPYTWQRVARETAWGRQQFIHVFEPHRPGQTRGATGLAAVLAKSKVLERFQDVSLEAAVVNAMYAAVIESEFDHAQVAEALGSETERSKVADSLLSAMADYHSADTVRFDGAKIPHLYPGEKFRMVTSEHPGPNFAEFEKSVIRHLAAGMGVSYEQLARDYSDTNYSGARAGMLEAFKFFTTKRRLVGQQFCRQVYALWLEEAIDKGDVELPPGAPDFYQAKSAWCASQWIGPAKGHIDPLKESSADALEMDRGLKTLEDACAERGVDWEANLEQIAREKRRMRELGIEPSDLNVTIGATSDAPTDAPERA
ncbi:MAG TPA: phage portal protein [Thiohalobacter sp.]|nr:phage portal protein [Thiohalobacter sp.]